MFFQSNFFGLFMVSMAIYDTDVRRIIMPKGTGTYGSQVGRPKNQKRKSLPENSERLYYESVGESVWNTYSDMAYIIAEKGGVKRALTAAALTALTACGPGGCKKETPEVTPRSQTTTTEVTPRSQTTTTQPASRRPSPDIQQGIDAMKGIKSGALKALEGMKLRSPLEPDPKPKTGTGRGRVTRDKDL